MTFVQQFLDVAAQEGKDMVLVDFDRSRHNTAEAARRLLVVVEMAANPRNADKVFYCKDITGYILQMGADHQTRHDIAGFNGVIKWDHDEKVFVAWHKDEFWHWHAGFNNPTQTPAAAFRMWLTNDFSRRAECLVCLEEIDHNSTKSVCCVHCGTAMCTKCTGRLVRKRDRKDNVLRCPQCQNALWGEGM
jgi:hypothetical protein